MGKELVKIDVNERLGVEKAIKKFKRLCEAYGVAKEYKRRKNYVKPSMQKKEKLAMAEKRRKKNIRRVAYGKDIV